MRRPILLATSALALLLPSIAVATETISYSYDARGRLVQVAHSGTINDGLITSYTLDRADNRLSVSGSTPPPPGPAFSIGNATATEGSPLVFTVSRSGATTGTASVDYGTADGTAIAGSDYTSASGSLSFAIGEASKALTIVTIDDTAQESGETALVNLSNPSAGMSLGTVQGSGTIADNDAPAAPSFSINNASIAEGGALSFTISKAGTASGSLSVNYTTANQTATAGTDYTATSGTLTFAATDTSKNVTVVTLQDSLVEPNEQLELNLSGATGGSTISGAQGLGTINDDDVSGVSFAISNASVTEGGTLVFTVTKTGSTASSFTMNYATANGTASSGDYTAASGTLTFAPTQTTGTINVATKTDSFSNENDETVLMNLSGLGAGATFTDSQGVGTIINVCGAGC